MGQACLGLTTESIFTSQREALWLQIPREGELRWSSCPRSAAEAQGELMLQARCQGSGRKNSPPGGGTSPAQSLQEAPLGRFFSS